MAPCVLSQDAFADPEHTENYTMSDTNKRCRDDLGDDLRPTKTSRRAPLELAIELIVFGSFPCVELCTVSYSLGGTGQTFTQIRRFAAMELYEASSKVS